MTSSRFILRFLLENGATTSINATRDDGEAPLHTACRQGFLDIVKTLTSKPGINPYGKESIEGNTALHIACSLNHMPIALHLIATFPDLIYTKNDVDRQTPLFYANETVRKAIKGAYVKRMQGNALAVASRTFSDVRFTLSNGDVIFAHRILLSLRCPKLLPPEDQNNMPVSDVDHGTMVALLNYLYTDRAPTERSHAAKLIPISDKFGIPRLKKICVDVTTNIPVVIPDSTFQKDMMVAVNNEKFSDVRFVVEGREIACHRVVLSQHEYFRTMLGAGNSRLREADQHVISISEVSHEVFKSLIHYCYTWDVVGLEADYVIELFQQANLFLLDGLRHVCEEYITNLIALDNACQLYSLAENYKSLFLGEACFDFLIYHYDELRGTPDYNDMPQELKNNVEFYMKKRDELQQRSKAKQPPRDTNYSLL